MSESAAGTTPADRVPPAPATPVHLQAISGAHLREGFDALAMLLSGMLVFGGTSWWISDLLGWRWILPVGLIGGMGVAIAYIWFRYGDPRR